MNESVFYFKISSHTIKMVLSPSSSPYSVHYWGGRFKREYSHWLLSSKPIKIDATIYFSQKPFSIKKTKNIYTLDFFEKINNKRFETYYFISHSQFLFLLQVVLTTVSTRKNSLLVHASSCLFSNKKSCCLFIGKSGAGKSTISSLLQDDYQKIADDTTFVSIRNNRLFLYQVPFDNLHTPLTMVKNQGVELTHIYFLFQSHRSRLVPIMDKNTRWEELVSSLWIEDASHTNRALHFAQAVMNSSASFFDLHFPLHKKSVLDMIQRSQTAKI